MLLSKYIETFFKQNINLQNVDIPINKIEIDTSLSRIPEVIRKI
jgi:hypothetical protein